MDEIVEGNIVIAKFMGYKFAYYKSYDEVGDEYNYVWKEIFRSVLYTDEKDLVDNIVYGDNRYSYKEYFKGYNESLYYHLIYHESWDALMPVVEKIETLGYGVRIEHNFCWINRISHDYIPNSYSDIQGEGTKIENTHKAIVKFIQWYNENKK